MALNAINAKTVRQNIPESFLFRRRNHIIKFTV